MSAPSASSKIRTMNSFSGRVARFWAVLAIVGTLWNCAGGPTPGLDSSPPLPTVSPAEPAVPSMPGADDGPLPTPLLQPRSRWVAARWAELPGFPNDALHEAWNAWIRSCERPGAAFAALCPEIRLLSLASGEEQRRWMLQRLQPYRVEPLGPATDGLLTGYYEPTLQASRTRRAEYQVPLYRPPPGLASRKPWYTRKEMETLPEVVSLLSGQEIAWLADPIDALVLQIQGSGRLRFVDAAGGTQMVRLAYSATNEQPYGSVGRWLLDQGQLREASWPSIKDWIAKNPQRIRELLWSNPRMVFFREEPLSDMDAAFGPKGAQGVALTPGRSIAVDRDSIPYGTPVWLVSGGPVLNLQRLVLAQDTGSAITGAVRADYFAGWGPQAADLAGRLKQPLQLWVLWPK
jgi:membrane-bound lytic murein transglycosylase A